MKKIKIIFVLICLLSATGVKADLYAVIVGISKYKETSMNLRYAAADAEKFYNLLTNGKKNPKIILLVNENATRSNILQTINALYKQAKPADRIIFFFSGHGDEGYFLQYDAGADHSSLLKHEDIQKAFKQSQAGVKLCLGDACFAGSIRNKSLPKLAVNFHQEYKDDTKSVKDNIIVFMSSRDYQYSQEDSELKQGLFTYYLIQSFQGKADINNDKKVTAKEMYTYVRNNVASATSNHQVPVMFGNFSENTVIVSYK